MKRVFALILLTALLLTGCGGEISASPSASSTEPVSATFFAMDTIMNISVYGQEETLAEAEERVYALEASLSVTEETSEIHCLNTAGSAQLSADAAYLLEQALSICELTDGALDVSIYPVLRAWGFTTGEYRVPGDEEIAELLGYVGYEDISFDSADGTVTLKEGMQIDLGSIAKGYTGDCLSQLFKQAGVTSGLLDLGGNVHTIGAKPDGSAWRVGIRDPQSEDTLAVIQVKDQAVITSGGYERCFEEDGQTYWHILDPKTGAPARSGLLSVTVVGDSGLLCDGLSTSLFVLGVEDAAQLWREHGGFEAVLVAEDGRVYITQGLEDTFTFHGTAGERYTLEVIR